MATKGKLEAQITIPSGNWTIAVTDTGGGPRDIFLTADNTYYWSSAGNDSVDLPARLAQLLTDDGTLAGTYTCTVSAGDGGTGKLTISCDVAFSATWTDTDFRDACGFDGNISSGTSATGAEHVEGLWLAECPTESLFGLDDAGYKECDGVTTVAPDGTAISTLYNTRTANELVWNVVSDARSRTQAETTINESFQTFWENGVWGLGAWATAGGPVRWHEDADTDGTYTEYRATMTPTIDMRRRDSEYSAWYRIATSKLFKV